MKARVGKAKQARLPGPHSLRVSDAFRDFVVAQLEGLGDLVPRAMFGGVGLYCDGWFFAILARDTLYLKTDPRRQGEFARRGCQPFRPYPKRSRAMNYASVPADVLESAPELLEWARRAVQAARAAAL